MNARFRFAPLALLALASTAAHAVAPAAPSALAPRAVLQDDGAGTPGLVPADAQPEADEAPAPKVVVRRFDYAGATLFRAIELDALLAEYIDRPLTLMDLYQAADRLARAYHERGFTLASVGVPAQRIADGVVRLEVVEGQVDSIEVSGNRLYGFGQLEGYLAAVQPGRTYHGAALENALLQMNRLPGLTTRAVLKPGATYGTSALVIETEETRASVSVINDNHGRENLGVFRTSLSGTLNNPLAFGDQLQLLAVHSEQNLLNYAFAQYSVPLPVRGDPRLALSYGNGAFELADSFAGLTGRNRTGRAALSWPLTLTRTAEDSVGVAITRTLADADLVGNPISAVDLTVYEVSGTFQQNYANGAIGQLRLVAASNFDRSTDTDVQRDDQRLRAEFDFQHLQPLARFLDGTVRVNGVYSPDPLPEISQVALGGPDNVRGYPASEVRGDRGLFGSLGLRTPVRLGAVTLAGRGFADAGEVRRLGQPAAGAEYLWSAGVGADCVWRARTFSLAARADWSFPLDSYVVPGDDHASRLFGSLAVNF